MFRWLTLVGLMGALAMSRPVLAEPYGATHSSSAHETPEEEAIEHAHGPRHGGYFGDADDLYHYEALLESSRRLILYVNDELNQPLDVRPLDGRWMLHPDDPAPLTGRFTPSDDGAYFFAELPLKPQETPVHVKVEVLKGSAWAGMEFVLPRAADSRQLGTLLFSKVHHTPTPEAAFLDFGGG